MSDGRVAPGDIIARKYRVERVLGQGNMGFVVAATHVDLGQLVALKLMLPGKASTPELRERFLREARAAVRLKSQHVARVLDVGAADDGSPYIVMEFLEGKDLDATLKEKGPLPFGEAVEYVLQACEAVGEAHAAGIIHRDLKPANLFLTKDVSGAPCVKVLDFGISKLSGAELTLTHESQALGSPLYMSPEAMGSAKGVDARTDIWALGIILYQLIAGRTPFHATTVAELCGRVLFGDATPLADYRTDAPQGFEAVILRCLERDRDKRFTNVAEFAAALLPFAPLRARVYPERVARVMGVEPSVRGSTPSFADLQGTLPLTAAHVAPRAPLPSAPAVAPMTAVPAATAATAMGAGSNPSLVLSASQSPGSFSQPSQPTKARNRGWIVVGAVAALAIPAVLLGMNMVQPSTDRSPAAAQEPASAAAPPRPPAAEISAMVASPPSTTPPASTHAQPPATTPPIASTPPSGSAERPPLIPPLVRSSKRAPLTPPASTVNGPPPVDYDQRR